jgi:hypothetical protein
MAWASAFQACGIETAFWDIETHSAYDVFDQFEPTIFLGQSYNLNKPIMDCIYERPHLKIGLRAGDWGSHTPSIDHNRFNILTATSKELERLEKLQHETGQISFVHIHYPEYAVEQTHDNYKNIGITPISLMMCADTFSYGGGSYKPELECDIGFVGGFWPYKGQVIEPYLFPLLEDINKYSVKIFGNQRWNVNQYCGFIEEEMVKDLFMSAKICPNLSEPHAQEYGFDVNERIFKVLYAGGFCISDNVEGYKMFEDGIVIAHSPKDFAEKVEFYKENPNERLKHSKKGQKLVKENHTGFHRVAKILESFGLKEESQSLIKEYNTLLLAEQK